MTRDWTTKEKHLLLVCRTTPRPDGDKAQRRNWRLLKIASRTHRVHLATLLDGRLSLVEWRGLARRTEKLAIVTRGLTPVARRLRRQLLQWAGQQRYRVVLCDDPTLWPTLDAQRADLRLCTLEHHHAPGAHALPPDVVRLPHHEAVERLTKLLAPRKRRRRMVPEVVVKQAVPLRRAA